MVKDKCSRLKIALALIMAISVCFGPFMFVYITLNGTAEGNEPDYQGIVLDITFDVENDKTYVFLDTATIILNGQETSLVKGKEYKLWVAPNGDLAKHEQVDQNEDEETEDGLPIWVFIIIGVSIMVVLIIIISIILTNGPPKEYYKDEE